MKVILIGDIHGNPVYFHSDYLTANSIQLGDMGFRYSEWLKNNESRPNDWKEERRYFIDGNHEYFPDLKTNNPYPYEVQQGLWHIPRGYRSGNTLFLGGAYSIDKHRRTLGYDWFPEEQMNTYQFNKIMDSDLDGVDTIVSHDVPAFIYPKIGIFDTGKDHCKALWEMFNIIKPRLWISGHHHKFYHEKIAYCNFFILNIAQKREFDLPLADGFFTNRFE